MTLRASLSRNLSDVHRFVPEHTAHLVELIARVARLTADVGSVAMLLGVLDAGPLCSLGRFSLCLSGRGHEANECVTDGLLHRVFGRAVEGEVVDHRSDHHAPPHELADGVAHVLIISPEAINPTDHKDVTGPQLIEQAATLGAPDKATVET